MDSELNGIIVLPAKCFKCGTELMIDGNGDYGDTSMIYYYTCPYCGCSYEVCEPEDEEKENFQYWKDN